ncbi:MAG: ABC transporter permease [Planctomycetota bacterium]
MLRIAFKMLAGDRAKYLGLVAGIAFTCFLVTFAASFFCGFMTRSYALIAENPLADVWVMDRAVASVEPATNIASSALDRVRSVEGVRFATPLAVGTAEVRFADGRFQSFQVIAVDDKTLAGAPAAVGSEATLRAPDAAIVAAGGTTGKLETPAHAADQWPGDGPHLGVATRALAAGDEIQVNDHRMVVSGTADALPRFPPRPLLYTTLSTAHRVLLPERHRLTFVLVSVQPGSSPPAVARAIEARTGLRARTADEFKEDTVLWTLENSEDVGDVTAMLLLAMSVGFGATGIMLSLFTSEHRRQYAVLRAMGATPGELLVMIAFQAGTCAVLGSGLGLGLCALLGQAASGLLELPFRMMWFTPLAGVASVIVVSVVAAAVSARPILRLEPASVFAGR